MRLRIICWRRRSRTDGWPGSSNRGLMIADARSADFQPMVPDRFGPWKRVPMPSALQQLQDGAAAGTYKHVSESHYVLPDGRGPADVGVAV